MKKTLREIHEEAAGMGLDQAFFTFNNINPDELIEVKPPSINFKINITPTDDSELPSVLDENFISNCIKSSLSFNGINNINITVSKK